MNAAGEIIAAEIRQRGPVSFARFMELALYCPLCGYYEQEADRLGRRGDYFTSVSVGPLFGELLAFQFAGWLEELETRSATLETRPRLVEAGAHDGKLARDILTWLREHRPALFARFEYGILDASARRQEWQRRTLAGFEDKVRWFSDPASIGVARLKGIIFANELLDALPVHRLRWDAGLGEWGEWGVDFAGGRFVWTRLPLSPRGSHGVPCIPEELRAVLPDEFTLEICPAAVAWWRQAAAILNQGRLVTLDYGLSADEFLSPHRSGGTLRAYRHHQISGDVLADPGEQDLTAHVNFTAIQAAGEAAGLATEDFTTQARFLVRIAERAWSRGWGFGERDAARLRQFQTLTHPEHLGRPFRVLVQARTA